MAIFKFGQHSLNLQRKPKATHINLCVQIAGRQGTITHKGFRRGSCNQIRVSLQGTITRKGFYVYLQGFTRTPGRARLRFFNVYFWPTVGNVNTMYYGN